MIDHIAHPSFDAAVTHRFYTEVLGAQLTSAFSGDSAEWNARYLLTTYHVEGVELDFFTYEGIVRPASDGLPRDIRHIGVAVAAGEDLERLRRRVESRPAEHWIERRDDGSHLYVEDPNGLVLEFSVAAPPFTPRPEAIEVLQAWIG